MLRIGPRDVGGGYCAVCGRKFVVGDYTTPVSIGPDSEDDEQVRNYLLGEPYLAEAKEIHWNCAVFVKRGIMA